MVSAPLHEARSIPLRLFWVCCLAFLFSLLSFSSFGNMNMLEIRSDCLYVGLSNVLVHLCLTSTRYH
ncbi:hypothetical protein BS17DRAFT_565610 [Gyrodon lividus]|nr:hypothetical protein BS17DRAFT_565610 [Gyrodon lividus]